MEANEYRKRVAAIATSMVGSAKDIDDDLFSDKYAELAKSTPLHCGAYDIGKFCVFVMRLAGVPASIFPNILCEEDFDTLGTADDIQPARGDVVLIRNKLDDSEAAIVTDVNQRSLSVVSRQFRMDSDAVWAKNIAIGSDFIRARISPDYGFERTRGLLRKTQVPLVIKGTFVRRFQNWLKAKGDNAVVADGNVTKEFIRSLVADWQTHLNRSAKAGVPVTGTFDAESSRGANMKTLQSGSRGNLVYILQGTLYAHGYDPKGFDGKFTKSTEDAVIAFQRARKLQESGTTTAETWESLLTKW